MRLAHEVGEHLLRRIEVGDDAASDRAHRPDVTGTPPDHVACAEANRLDGAGRGVQRHDGRFADDDASSTREDAGVCGAKVNRQVTTEPGHIHSFTPLVTKVRRAAPPFHSSI